MATSNNTTGSFTTLLQIVFITLKLLDKIDWSWWWVMSPTWIMIVIALMVYVIFLIFKIFDK